MGHIVAHPPLASATHGCFSDPDNLANAIQSSVVVDNWCEDLAFGPALFVGVRKGRSMCGNPQADRTARRGVTLLAAKWPLYTLRGKSHNGGSGRIEDQQL